MTEQPSKRVYTYIYIYTCIHVYLISISIFIVSLFLCPNDCSLEINHIDQKMAIAKYKLGL